MLLRERPLLVDGLDAGLYVDRPALETSVLDPIRKGRNVLLLGESGSGKSTLLRKVVADFRREGRHAVIVNGTLADDAGGFLDLVEAMLEEHLVGASEQPRARNESDLVRLVHAARRLRRDQSVAILVDGPISQPVAYDLFGRLRDELWSTGHSWTVAVRPADSAALRTPPADAFWSRMVEIPPLDLDETRQLLEAGLSSDEHRFIDQDRPISGVYPRNLIQWVRERLEGGDDKRQLATDPQWFLTDTEVGRSEAIALTELQGLGRPVSVHDEDFLKRLGWSRPYAQRVLSGLEARGFLRSIPERNDQPGRPRKLYELSPPPAQ
jgi:energy-coupling factor transporter ATP-binding protein EcfA2